MPRRGEGDHRAGGTGRVPARRAGCFERDGKGSAGSCRARGIPSRCSAEAPLADGITWRRSDPWLTRIVDCSADGPDRCWGWPLAGLQIVAWHDEDASRQQVDADLDTLMDKLCEAFRAGN